MPRTKPPEERRAQLLDAAQGLFVDQGIAGTTIEDITSRAGMAKGAFYLHYRSKDDVVVGLQERFSERFSARMAAAVAAEDDWGRKLDALVDSFYVGYMDEIALHDVLYHHPADRRDDHPAVPVPVDVIGDVLAEGVAAGAFDVGDVELTALLIYSAIHGAFEDRGPGGRRPSKTAIVGAAQRLVRRAAGLADPT